MAEYDDREHFIPLRKADLVDLLLNGEKLKPLQAADREGFAQFARLTTSIFHFEYLEQLEALKDSYCLFDPDADTRSLKEPMPDEKEKKRDELFARFTSLLEKANFTRLPQEKIQEAIEGGASAGGMNMDVDFTQFDRLEVFVRGDETLEVERRPWWKFFKKETIQVPVFQRMALILKFKRLPRTDVAIDLDDVFLKIFKDIPKADLETLLPGAKIKLTGLDKSLIGFPLITGVGMLLYNILWPIISFLIFATSVVISLALWPVALALGGYGYKSYYSYQVKKQKYSLQLTKNLYYRTLDSNSGVIMRLMDEAEEQECREALLGYFSLWKHAPKEGWTAEMLDDFVEMYLEQNANLKVDFEIGDALEKLERLRVVEKVGDRYKAVAIDEALERLDYRWDNYFKYNQSA